MAAADWRLGVPILLWFVGYVFFLRHFVPKLSELARTSSEFRSLVMARVVDSYTNILTVKLFARLADEDAYVREAIDQHQGAMAAHMGLITRFMIALTAMNALLLVGTAAIGIALWANGTVSAAIVATALPLAWQTANAAGWVSWEVTASSRTSASCRKACSRSPCRTPASTAPARGRSKSRAARSASRTSPSATAARTSHP